MIKFTQFFLSLSLLILLHEFGHFITARWFKTRVDKFYLFFDFLFPFSNIFKFSLFKKKIGETEYGIGWFPFGGYVDIVGMMADPDAKEPKAPEPHEFRAKKPWQRLIILAGGITVNFLLAIVIYSLMSWTWGEDYLPPKNAKYGVFCDSLALELGMKHGDLPVAVGGVPIDKLHTTTMKALLDEAKTIDVMRDGKKVSIAIAGDFEKKFLARDVKTLFTPQWPFVIDSVVPGKPAAAAGFQKGDSLFTLGKDTLRYFPQFVTMFQRYKSKPVEIGFYRNGQFMTKTVTLTAEGQIGVESRAGDKFLKYEHISYDFFPAWQRGTERTIETLNNYVKQLRLLFSKEGASKIGGFGSIASVFPSEWDWEQFWGITAFLSVILAFMNLLPIPVLDGGYILFVLWEMVTGRKVSDKFMQRALTIGMYIVLALLIFSNGNDILRLFK